MATVIVRKNEALETALKRFKKICDREGILQELKKREYYQKPSEIKNQKKREQKRKLFRLKGKQEEFDKKIDKVYDQE